MPTETPTPVGPKCNRTITLQVTVNVCRNFGNLPLELQQQQIEDAVRHELRGLDAFDGWTVTTEVIEAEGE